MTKHSKKQELRQALAKFDEHCESKGYHLSQYADPSVERLLEGFCYLTQQIDDFLKQSSPDLTSHLLNIVWPASLHDIPAMSIAQVMPKSYPIFLAKNTLLTQMIEDGKLIKFTTMVESTILPLVIETVAIDYKRISINIVFQERCDIVNLERLLLYVDPEADDAYHLAYLLRQKLNAMSLTVNNQRTFLPAGCFPVWLSENIDDPFVLINRFFQCPKQFLFFEIKDLHHYLSRDCRDFTLSFEFQETVTSEKNSLTLFHVNCVPIMNVFSQACEPLTISCDRDCYELYCGDQSDQEKIIEITQVSAKTLAGDSVALTNSYIDSKQHPSISYFLHKLKNTFQFMIDVNQVRQPLILSAQALVHQVDLCKHFYWQHAQLTLSAGHLKARLLEKLSLPIENRGRDSVEMLAVFQSKITSQTRLSELQFLLKTLLCQHLPKYLRMIAAVMRFTAKSVFQLNFGVVREVIIWEIQLNQENFETLSGFYQFSELLERLIYLYRPANKYYQIKVIRFPDGSS